MGEAKIKKAEAAVRPNEAILRMKMAVEASKSQQMDADTADFMQKLRAVVRWLEHLEKETGIPPGQKLDA